ncbi:hypothetical protein BaRGS_00026636 [Batillaria attramentaria]|uniref:Uncharacterized protein n=1 Tax=Batillaria attramentaria TaxID=370345 RepID=A0ABD0K5H2_9CAEN
MGNSAGSHLRRWTCTWTAREVEAGQFLLFMLFENCDDVRVTVLMRKEKWRPAVLADTLRISLVLEQNANNSRVSSLAS